MRRPSGSSSRSATRLVLESLAKPAGVVPFMMPKRVADTPFTQQIKDPIGSGPFLFKSDEWRPGEKVVYAKNPKYVPRAEPSSASPAARRSRSTGSNGRRSAIRRPQ